VTLVYCGQTVGWIKMKLGMQVGLGPGHIVLDGDQAPKKGAEPPIFGPFQSWPNGWMYQDTTWYGGRPQPRRHCVRWGLRTHLPSPKGYGGRPQPRRLCGRWGPSSPPGKRAQPPPNLWFMSIVAKRLDGSRCHFSYADHYKFWHFAKNAKIYSGRRLAFLANFLAYIMPKRQLTRYDDVINDKHYVGLKRITEGRELRNYNRR